MYGLIALFDEKTENYLHHIYSELDKLGFSHYGKNTPNHRPHITLATYQTLNVESYMTELENYARHTHTIPLCLNTIGTFFKSTVLFLAPKPSLQLLQFHQRYHQTFAHYHTDSNSLYLPENWIPHCTIANHLTEEQYTHTLAYCRNQLINQKATIKSLALIQPTFIDGKCINVPIIYTINLKNCNKLNM